LKNHEKCKNKNATTHIPLLKKAESCFCNLSCICKNFKFLNCIFFIFTKKNLKPKFIFVFSDVISISCNICFKSYDTNPGNAKQHPQTFCTNNHVFCKRCSSHLKNCPICQAKQIPTRSVEIGIFQRIEDKRKQLLTDIPTIPVNDFEWLSEDLFATGSCANIFRYKWKNTVVALKKPRINPNPSQMEDIHIEAALCIKIHHPNIVSLFGLTQLENIIFLVSEWSDLGNLRENMKGMKKEHKIKVSLCICEGLNYMHLIGIAHQNMKPENVLLFGDKSIAKISDFGTSKVIQTIMLSNDLVGNPKYTAPEQMEEGIQVWLNTMFICSNIKTDSLLAYLGSLLCITFLLLFLTTVSFLISNWMNC
jgi:serine/threonine protein kinase